jgi:hypothetical protein
MPLTSKQAFKVGFLYRCAEEGLSKEATEKRVAVSYEKQAIIPLLGQAAGVTGYAARLLTLAPLLGIGAAGLGGHLVGSGLGKLQAEATSGSLPSDRVPEEVKRLRHAEILGEYARQTREAKRRAVAAKRKRKRELSVVTGYP